jgi:predicted RNase H-like HicB family nuclease
MKAAARGWKGVHGVTLGACTPRNLTAAVHQEEDWYVAQCLEVDVASQGRTINEALSNLAEAVALYLEEVDDPQRHMTATPLVTSFQVPGAA